MTRRLFGLLPAIAAALSACTNVDSGITHVDYVPPPPPPSPYVLMRVEGPQDVGRDSGEVLADFPRLRVVESISGTNMAGVTVTFRRESTGELKDVVTDAQGIARFGDFVFGPTIGTEIITARSTGLNTLSFSGTTRGSANEFFDLTRVANRPLPIDYSSPGRPWKVIGGHFVLMKDGTYYFYYDINVASDSLPARPSGRYERQGSVLDFYESVPANRHFARGSISGTTMTVEYDDYLDFETEIYVKR